MRDADRIIINQSAKIKEAMKQLDQTMERLLICVDEKKQLAGVINDGDIRRAILKKAQLNEPIEKYMQKTPQFVTEQTSYSDATRYVTNRVNVLPVIDHERRVVGCYSFKDKEEFIDIKKRKVTILGMGYVGLTLAVSFGDVGFDVTGFDLNEPLISDLKKRKSHFYEKGLQQYLDQLVGKNVSFVSKLKDAHASVYIITVGTPIIKGTKNPNTDYLLKAAKEIGVVLEAGDLVVLRSTVPIGSCRKKVLPVLEKESGLKAGDDFYLAYAPERTTEGQALSELRTNPQIVGGYNEKSTEIASRLFNSLTHSVIDVESLEAAELCKLMDNSYRDHRFAFINQMVPLAETLKLDLCKIVDAVNHGYQRNSIPKPSPGVGGACLSKDPYILNKSFEEFNLNASLVMQSREVNEGGPSLVRDKLRRLLKKAGKDIKTARIFLIGLAFKGQPETSDLRDSTSVWFIDTLPSKDNVCAYDPVVEHKDIKRLGIEPVSLKKGFKEADAVVILNNHRSYSNINMFEMTRLMNRPAVVIDTWHLFEPIDFKRMDGVLYGGVGND